VLFRGCSFGSSGFWVSMRQGSSTSSLMFDRVVYRPGASARLDSRDFLGIDSKGAFPRLCIYTPVTSHRLDALGPAPKTSGQSGVDLQVCVQVVVVVTQVFGELV
jgi:hypothetical protein